MLIFSTFVSVLTHAIAVQLKSRSIELCSNYRSATTNYYSFLAVLIEMFAHILQTHRGFLP